MQFRIHPLRAKQLRLLAKLRGLTIAATIESLIDDRAIAGEIADAIDGITFQRQHDALVIELNGQPLPPISIQAARAFAAELRLVADRDATETSLGLGGELALEACTTGHGVAFSAGTARLLASASIAGTIARQIDKAAA